MSRKFKTEEDYLRSGRVPFVFHDEELGDVTVYAYKRWQANYEFKRMAARLRKQKDDIQELTRSTRKRIDSYRKKMIAEQRRLEVELGIMPLNERSLFDNIPEALNDGELNIIGVGQQTEVQPKKEPRAPRKRKNKRLQKILKFD